MFGKRKDAAYWRRQLEDVTRDFFDAQVAEQAIGLFDDPQRADDIVDESLYRYFEENEKPAELVWPIFHHFMDRAGRIAVFDWSAGPGDWIREFDALLAAQGLAPIAEAQVAEIRARAARTDRTKTSLDLRAEMSAVLHAHGFALMDEGPCQDAFVNYFAPPEAARRWDYKTIGRDMMLTIIPPGRL